MTALTVADVVEMLDPLALPDDVLVILQRNPTTVAITGPRFARAAAFDALMDRGLSCGPYPESDHYRR